MKKTVGTPCWVDLMTPDPEVARNFYTKVLGWTYQIQPEEYGGYAMCHIEAGTVAGIGKPPAGNEMPSVWTVYLATEDIAKTVADWTAKGGQVLTAPFEVPSQGHMAVVSDPTGAVVGLWQPLAHRGFDSVGPPGAPCWFEVNTPKSETVRDFFVDVFGLTAQRLEGMHYYTLHDDSPRYGVLQMTEAWEGIPPHWMTYFSVEDVPASAEVVKANGGKVHHGPFDTAQGPIAVCSDPTGAMFTIIKPQTA
ncbi:MAG: VOC family protein [Myxococcota bacterium]